MYAKVWLLDPTGMPTAGWGLSLSAYEMAQIGLMVLNKGIYNNTRIVSERWIEMMTQSYVSTDEKFGNQDYGFLWWLPHRTSDVIAAVGDGGKVIYIDRKNQIVVAITAYFKPMVFDRVEYIEKNIVEADVRIGGNVIINPGVSIGDNVVIGSGSVVTKNIPSGVIAAGNPCRVIREISESDKNYWNEQLDGYLKDKDVI